MSYKIVKDAKDHYQVMHPDGSKFTVPKKGISKQMHEKIMGMPKLYDGGRPGDESFSVSPDKMASIEPPKFTPEEIGNILKEQEEIPVNLGGDVTKGIEGLEKARMMQSEMAAPQYIPGPKFGISMPGEEPKTEVKAPEKEAEKPAAQTDQAAKPIPTEEEPAMPAMQMPDLSRFDPYAAVRESQKAAQTLAKAQEASQIELNNQAAKFEAAKEAEHKEMQDFIDNHQIKSGNYWASKDTGGKVMASLAMVLGGIGAGMTGGPNYAMQLINKAIEDDMEAQKENRNSGLNALLQRGKDRDAVMANYRANTIQKIQDQNNLYMAQAKTADQKAAAQALDMKLQEMKTQYQVAADNRLAMNYLYRKGIPTKSMPFSLLNDEKVRRQLVDVNGISYFYKGGADGAEIQNKMEGNYRPIREGILRLKELGRASIIPGTKEYEEAQALAQMLPNAVAGFYSSAIESKRISDTEGHRAEAALSNPASIMQAIVGGNVRGMTALREMDSIIDSARSQLLSGYEAMPKPISGMGEGKLPLNK